MNGGASAPRVLHFVTGALLYPLGYWAMTRLVWPVRTSTVPIMPGRIGNSLLPARIVVRSETTIIR